MTSIRNYYKNRYKYLYIPSLIFFVLSLAAIIYINLDFNKNDIIYKDFERYVRDSVKYDKTNMDSSVYYHKVLWEAEDFTKNNSKKWITTNVAASVISLFILIIIFLITFKVIERRPIYCPYCLKTVLKKEIVPYLCPFCKTENKLFTSLYNYCINSDCKSIIPSIPCPHCNKQIDLLGEYDFEKINIKRYGKNTKI
jgi:hypothetical protein